jgi:uncharacterized repeat protein (TIGR01451 family)
MKQIQIHRNWYFAALIAIIAIAALVPQQASALGTPSGTTINNAASVVYSVGSVTQPLYTGPTTTFAVDTKVIFNVSKVDVAPVQVAPGDNTSSTTRRLQFQLRNDSNANIRFRVTAANLTSGLTVTFGVTNYTDTRDTFSSITACFDNGDNVCAAGEELKVVNADTTDATIIITGDIPSNTVNADIVGALLTSIAVDAGGAALVETAAPTIGGVDIVLANGAGTDNIARSGTFTDRSSWQVSAALLTVTKTAVVYSDPYNGTTNPKAIPGAVITYTITVANGPGAATATNVTISDSLNAEITSVPAHLAFATQFTDGVNACAAGQGIVVNNTCNTNLSDGDNANWNVTAANTVTAGGLTLAPNSNAVVKFQAVIQ